MRYTGLKTEYKGVQYKSLLEATWAVFFDQLGFSFDYEPQKFPIHNADFVYTPDFYIYDLDKWIEIKPYEAIDGGFNQENAENTEIFHNKLVFAYGYPIYWELQLEEITSYVLKEHCIYEDDPSKEVHVFYNIFTECRKCQNILLECAGIWDHRKDFTHMTCCCGDRSGVIGNKIKLASFMATQFSKFHGLKRIFKRMPHEGYIQSTASIDDVRF